MIISKKNRLKQSLKVSLWVVGWISGIIIGNYAVLAKYSTDIETKRLHEELFIKHSFLGRIDLREKANQRFNILPIALYQAYRKGDIKGYYPNDFSKVLEIKDCDDHFTAFIENRDGFECCGPPTEEQMRAELGPLAMYLDFDEDRYFDRTKSVWVNKIRTFRLVWFDPRTLQAPRYVVAFKVDDDEVRNLLEKLKVAHKMNDAAVLSYRQLIDLHDFNYIPLHSTRFGTAVDIYRANKIKEQMRELEQSLWEY